MGIKLNNRAAFAKKTQGYDWFDWEVFVDEPQETLDKIDHVTYFLHETFPQPVKTVSEPENEFLLKSRGWGEFEINARVVFKDGTEEKVKYWLDLSKDD